MKRYLSCAIKHKTVNYYRFWIARRVAAKTAKQKLQSPDLAITEAAVGAGVTSILFFLTLKKVHALKGTHDE